MYLPNANKQAAFVEMITSLDEKEVEVVSQYKSQLNDIDDLRQSLLQRAFAGELTESVSVQAFNDNERDERLSAATLAIAFNKHLAEQRQNTFGHVKAQKTLHLTESIAGLDLGRQPDQYECHHAPHRAVVLSTTRRCFC